MENLVLIRKEKRLSQVELAEAVGVKQATISRIEKGVDKPSYEGLEHIAEALDVTIVELIDLPEIERKILPSFRAASPQRRNAILALLESEEELR